MEIYQEVRSFAGKTSNTLRMRGIFSRISRRKHAMSWV